MGSTIVGQAVDTVIVVSFIYYDQPISIILNVIASGYIFKVAYEILATPLTYLVVSFLKDKEGIDTFDKKAPISIPLRSNLGLEMQQPAQRPFS